MSLSPIYHPIPVCYCYRNSLPNPQNQEKKENQANEKSKNIEEIVIEIEISASPLDSPISRPSTPPPPPVSSNKTDEQKTP